MKNRLERLGRFFLFYIWLMRLLLFFLCSLNAANLFGQIVQGETAYEFEEEIITALRHPGAKNYKTIKVEVFEKRMLIGNLDKDVLIYQFINDSTLKLNAVNSWYDIFGVMHDSVYCFIHPDLKIPSSLYHNAPVTKSYKRGNKIITYYWSLEKDGYEDKKAIFKNKKEQITKVKIVNMVAGTYKNNRSVGRHKYLMQVSYH